MDLAYASIIYANGVTLGLKANCVGLRWSSHYHPPAPSAGCPVCDVISNLAPEYGKERAEYFRQDL